MNKELINLLEGIANKMGSTTEHLWEILVRQAPIECCKYIIQIFLFLGITGLFLWSLYYLLISDEEMEEKAWIGLIFFVLILACLGATTELIYRMITVIKNPEFWALKELLSNIR